MLIRFYLLVYFFVFKFYIQNLQHQFFNYSFLIFYNISHLHNCTFIFFFLFRLHSNINNFFFIISNCESVRMLSMRFYQTKLFYRPCLIRRVCLASKSNLLILKFQSHLFLPFSLYHYGRVRDFYWFEAVRNYDENGRRFFEIF
jgi:hypothetical protein